MALTPITCLATMPMEAKGLPRHKGYILRPATGFEDSPVL